MPEQQVQKVNPVQALEQSIAKAKDVKQLLSISAIRDRYIKNYSMATGQKDGEARYERDVFAFMEKVNTNPDLMSCDPFSIFAAFVKVGSYGVDPDKLYLQPQPVKQKDGSYKQMMKVSVDPFGKKELIERMKTITKVNDPVLVFNQDEFEVDPRGKRVVVHKQKFPLPNPSEDTVKAVYVTVEWASGKEQDFWLTLEELKKRRAASKMSGGGILWGTHYGEAAKKSVINYLWKAEYKKPESVLLFPQYEAPITAEDEEPAQEAQVVQDTPATPVEEFRPDVNEETGQIYEVKPTLSSKGEVPNFM